MEFLGQPKTSGAYSLLGVPGLISLDIDDDDCDVVIGIRPKSSPLPRRRSSVSDEEWEPPVCGSRRVSFADAKGLSLVHVKEFDTWDVPKLPGYDSSDSEGKDAEEYFLSPFTFTVPMSTEELSVKVQEQKVELETIELLPGTTIVKGVIRVLNISFDKAVYIRTSLDGWTSHFDLLAEYIPGSSDGLMDCFSFKITLVPPFGQHGARVDFCLRYETPVGTFWSNNNNKNYVLFCHQRTKDQKETSQKESSQKKSCLKTVSQNFSAVEIVSAEETSSQENIPADISKHGEKVDTVEVNQISDGRPGISEEEAQKLETESRQNCSRRSRRKAARMARVRDYFAQRDGVVNGGESDASPPEAKQAAKEENPEEKHSDTQSFPEGNSKTEDYQFVSEALATCSKTSLDVRHDTSRAQDYISNNEPEKPESINLSDSATLTGGATATDIPDNPSHSNDEPASAEGQNIHKSISRAEERSQKQGVNYTCGSNTASETADSVVSAESSESLVSQTTSFTFGTVVAPLYHQMFGRVGNESQSLGDCGNPVLAKPSVADLTQSYPHTERRESSSTVSADTESNHNKLQRNVIETQESNQEYLDANLNTPLLEKEEANLSMTAHDTLHHDTLQDPVEIKNSDQRSTDTPQVQLSPLGYITSHPQTGNILNTDLLDAQIPGDTSCPQGKAQEDILTCDLQNQTREEPDQAQLPESTCTQIKTYLDEKLAQSETQEDSQQTSFLSLQPPQSVSEHVSDDADQQASSSGANSHDSVDESNKEENIDETIIRSTTTNTSPEKDKLLETLHDLDANHISDSATEETESVSCFEIVEEKDVTTPETHFKTQEETSNMGDGNEVANNLHEDETDHSAEIEVSGEAAESLTKAVTSNNHVHGDMFVELKDEAEVISEKVETKTTVSKPEDLSLAEITDIQNWEMMVEEEEKNILTDEEGSKVINLSAEDTEAVEKEPGELMEDTGIEKNEDTIEKKTEEETLEITAAEEKEDKAEDALEVENRSTIGEEEIVETVFGKELDYVQTTKKEYIPGEEGIAEDTEIGEGKEEEEAEFEKEKHFAEMQEVNIKGTDIQEEDEIEEEEEMEIDFYDEDETDVKWGDQVKPEEQNIEEENPDYEEEMLVDEAGEEEIVDAESEYTAIADRQDEVECFEERLDSTQNKVEDGLSAPVNIVQEGADKNVIDKENTGEGQNAHISTEMHPCKEEEFQSNQGVTHDLSKAGKDESDFVAAERGLCILTDEPVSDQTSHDSASAESDSDDEVELYMHCLRAVHTGAQASKDHSKDTGLSVSKRPSVSRSKLLSTTMPSISESLDEEHLSCPQVSHEDTGMADIQPTAAALSASSVQEGIDRNVSWWKDTFSCSNISKTLLYATLLVVFLVVAYHYDFLACFGLYLITVVWLFCQGERQPVKNNKIG